MALARTQYRLGGKVRARCRLGMERLERWPMEPGMVEHGPGEGSRLVVAARQGSLGAVSW